MYNDNVYEPKRAKEVIIKHYWECMIPEHRHKTKNVAKRCIKKFNEKRTSGKLDSNEIAFRNLDIVEQILEGSTFASLGRGYGLSGSHVRDTF